MGKERLTVKEIEILKLALRLLYFCSGVKLPLEELVKLENKILNEEDPTNPEV